MYFRPSLNCSRGLIQPINQTNEKKICKTNWLTELKIFILESSCDSFSAYSSLVTEDSQLEAPVPSTIKPMRITLIDFLLGNKRDLKLAGFSIAVFLKSSIFSCNSTYLSFASLSSLYSSRPLDINPLNCNQFVWDPKNLQASSLLGDGSCPSHFWLMTEVLFQTS